ncbi:DNA translocase FtsK 4TM domain-containing protein, partial [Omnitrophica bacterium]|nr:DNA translocase FtsK 4TM domain-containing protein [Candidatus Omnitrophota bacterium]
MKKARINEIWGVLFLLLGLFTLASLIFFHSADLSFYTSHPTTPVQNYTGIIGAYTAFGLFLTFGISAYLIPGFFLLWAGCFFLQQVPEKRLFKFVGLGIALFSTSTLVTIAMPEALRFERGGAVGYLVGGHLLQYFGFVGSFILSGSCLLLSLLLATDFLLYPIAKKMFEALNENVFSHLQKLSSVREIFLEIWDALPFHRPGEGEPERKSVVKKVFSKDKSSEFSDAPVKVKRYQPGGVPESGEKPVEEEGDPNGQGKKGREQKKVSGKESGGPAPGPVVSPAVGEEPKKDGVIGSSATQDGDYQLPSVELLKLPKQAPLGIGDNLQENSKILETTLAEFGIEVKVVEVEQGPVITRYELLPAPGVKVNSIAALSDDISLALKAISVRLIIPIPGKSAIGIEVPNSVSSMVFLRELIETPVFRSHNMVLPLVLGKDTSGRPLIADLTTMPHILIAGTTGSGKTVCVNSIMTGLLYHCTPAELKVIMIDPKMVELIGYNEIPHMLSPVVTDSKKAAHTLNWVVNEMENRYKLFATVGVRNIQTFNSRPLSEADETQLEEVDSE